MYCPNCGFNNKVNVGVCINCKFPLDNSYQEKISILDSNINQEMNFIEDNIYGYDGKFIIVAEIKGFKINYGYCNTINEAIQRRDSLVDDGWPIPKGLLDIGEEISQNIIKKEDEFIVYNKINGEDVIFGKYGTLEEANAAKFKFIKNNWSKSSVKSLSKTKVRENIYKYENKKYSVQKDLDGKTHIFGCFNSRVDAFAVEKVLNKVNWKVSEVNNINKTNKNIFKIEGIFFIIFELNSKVYILGKYPSLELAIELRDGLIAEKIKTNSGNNIRDKHIWHVRGGFEVRNNVNGFSKTFGIYNSREAAIRARDEFIRNNWEEHFSEDSLFNVEDAFEDDVFNEVIFSLPPLEKMVVDAIDSLDKINFTSEDIKNSKSNLVRFYSKSKLDSKLENALNELIKLNLIKRCDESTFEKLWDFD